MSALPTPLQSKLNQAAESERKATEARVEEERVSLTTSIEDSLEAGLSVDRIKQSLQKSNRSSVFRGRGGRGEMRGGSGKRWDWRGTEQAAAAER